MLFEQGVYVLEADTGTAHPTERDTFCQVFPEKILLNVPDTDIGRLFVGNLPQSQAGHPIFCCKNWKIPHIDPSIFYHDTIPGRAAQAGFFPTIENLIVHIA